MLAFQSRDPKLASERGLREGNGNHTIQIVALARKERMLLHVQYYVEIAGWSAKRARFSVAAKSNASTVFHPRRNLRFNRALVQDAALPLALQTRVRNHAAR